MYDPLPDSWVLQSEHYNGEGERFGIATTDHPDWAGRRLLVIWDDPRPKGTGVAGLALLDADTVVWLREQL